MSDTPAPIEAETPSAYRAQPAAPARASAPGEMGLVMKAAQAKAAGRADGKAISTLVNSMLPS